MPLPDQPPRRCRSPLLCPCSSSCLTLLFQPSARTLPREQPGLLHPTADPNARRPGLSAKPGSYSRCQSKTGDIVANPHPDFGRLGRSQYGDLHLPHRRGLLVRKHHSRSHRLQCFISMSTKIAHCRPRSLERIYRRRGSCTVAPEDAECGGATTNSLARFRIKGRWKTTQAAVGVRTPVRV
jgi:hypothetical protein